MQCFKSIETIKAHVNYVISEFLVLSQTKILFLVSLQDHLISFIECASSTGIINNHYVKPAHLVFKQVT